MKLVILPGWQHSSEEWKSVCLELANRSIKYHVIDLPGFGSEPYNPNLNTLSDIANWCVHVIEGKTKGEKIVLCGHSYGGRVAVELAARHKLSIQRLILIGSPNIYRPNMATKFKKVLVSSLRPLRAIAPEALRKKVRSDDFEVVRGTELQKLFENIIAEDQTELLKTINLPTTLIWGETDTAAPLRLAEEMQDYINAAELEVIAGVGHNIHLEKPSLLAAKLATYVKTN